MSNRDEVVRLNLEGERAPAIAARLGISRARVYQLLREAEQSGSYRVEVNVKGAENVPLEAVGSYLRRALKAAGLRPERPLRAPRAGEITSEPIEES